jgi:cell division protein FtsL
MSATRLGLLVLVAAAMGSALGVVHAKHQSRKLFVELQALQFARDEMNVEWGRLQLEQGAWSTHGRVEEVAVSRLQMRMPQAEDIVLVRQ